MNTISNIRAAIAVFVLLTVVTGVVYPIAITALARVLPAPTPETLVGQEFTSPGYFWGRLSATAPRPYTAFDAGGLTGSTGTNFAPSNPALIEAASARRAALEAADAGAGVTRDAAAHIPVDLITASASGLDPHLSPAGILHQVPRVASVRGVPEERVLELVRLHTRGRALGVFGEPTVHVTELNRALDQLAPPASGSAALRDGTASSSEADGTTAAPR